MPRTSSRSNALGCAISQPRVDSSECSANIGKYVCFWPMQNILSMEMKRLGVKLNGQPETFSGLAGLGDLILTATGSLSRNHELGFRIGEGISPKDLLKNQFNVVEGVPTSISLQELCREQQVEMPISETVYSILHEGLDPNDALFQLLERKIPGPEIKRID